MRWVLRVLGGGILLAVVLCLGLYLFRVPAAKYVLSNQLGVSVTLDRLDLGLQGIDVENLIIGTPRAGQLDQSLKLGRLHVAYSLSDLRQDPPVIQEVAVTGVRFGVERYDPKTSNWSLMMPPSKAGGEPKIAPLGVRIKRLIVKDTQVSLVNLEGRGERLDFGPDTDLELLDFGAGNRFPVEKIVAAFARGYNKAAYQLASSRPAE